MRTLFNIQLVYFPKSKYAEPFTYTCSHRIHIPRRTVQSVIHTNTLALTFTHTNTRNTFCHHTQSCSVNEKKTSPFYYTIHGYHPYADDLRHKHLSELSTIIISDIAVSYRSYCRAIVEFRIENLSKVGKDGAHKTFLVRFFSFFVSVFSSQQFISISINRNNITLVRTGCAIQQIVVKPFRIEK